MKHEYKGLTIKIEQDQDCASPREWDNFGTLNCFHRDYNLGEKHSFGSPEELEAHIKETKAIALPVFAYEHGGITLSTGSFGCLWDSGQVGMIFATRDQILKEYSVKRITPAIREKAIALLEGEVKIYASYLEGNCYGYTVLSPTGDHIDSCWGFIDSEKYMIEEAKASGDMWLKDNAEGVAFAERYGMATA